MAQPAARQNDPVTGTDIHVLLTPPPTPTPLPFVGFLISALSPDVLVNGLPAATVTSIAQNMPPHVAPPGTSFSRPPTNLGTVISGSATVLVNNKPFARLGDTVLTCNDPVDAPTSRVAAGSPDVLVG
jgi:uncharacterized Zn-binding protein involved in type VI secretion